MEAGTQTLDILTGIVRPGQGRAGSEFIAPYKERWERALGSSIHPASLNVYVPGNFGAWPWLLTSFDESTRRAECFIEGVPSFVVWLRCPGPSWNEGHDDEHFYPNDTMLEVICSKKIEGIVRYSNVTVEVDLNALKADSGVV